MKFARVDRAAAEAFISRMVGNPKWDWSAGVLGVADILDGGETFAAVDDAGRPTVVFVLHKVDYVGGRELVVRAALQVGKGGNLVESVLPEIERVFGDDCAAVTIYTKRAGLVRKLEKAGYGDQATIVRKKLKC